jgi:hypothetical protein
VISPSDAFQQYLHASAPKQLDATTGARTKEELRGTPLDTLELDARISSLQRSFVNMLSSAPTPTQRTRHDSKQPKKEGNNQLTVYASWAGATPQYPH